MFYLFFIGSFICYLNPYTILFIVVPDFTIPMMGLKINDNNNNNYNETPSTRRQEPNIEHIEHNQTFLRKFASSFLLRLGLKF